MTKRVVCKHGNPMGVTIEPAEFYADGFGVGRDEIIQRVTMPVCGQCLLEAAGLSNNGETMARQRDEAPE